MDLDAYRAGAQAFASELGRAHLRRFAGLSPLWDPVAIHARHAALWDDAAIEALRERGERRLLRFAVEARIGERLATVEARRVQAEVEEDLAGVRAALAAEPEATGRAALEERRLDAVARRITPLAAEALDRVRHEARALGWPSARAMLGALHGVDLGALAATAEGLLRAQVEPDLPAWVRARHDLPHLHAVTAPRAPAGETIERLRAVLATLAVDERFAVDAAPRPGKSPRAFCAGVRVPDEVVLVADGGDPTALFHEAGHALHLTHRDAAAPFEDRHLVDRADAEAIAFLLEQAAAAPVDPLRQRRLAAAFLHDLDLLDAGPQPPLADRYAERLARATGLDWPRAPWLAGSDPLLGSADYLRGLERAGRLADRLGGDGWWTRPESGPELRRMLAA